MSSEIVVSHFKTLEELSKKKGTEIGVSDWIVVEQNNIDLFAEASLDYQWIHTDPGLAKVHSAYGTTVAHGFMVLSLMPKFLYEVIHIDNAVMGVNYGLDRVRFPREVPVDSAIRARVTLKELEEIADGGKITFNISIEIKNQEKPACSADFTVLIITEENESI